MQTEQNQSLSKTAVNFMLLLFILIALSFYSQRADAETNSNFTVTKTADTNDGTCDSDCSLREAIAAADASSGLDIVIFDIPEKDAACSADNNCILTIGSLLPNITDINRTSVIGPGSGGKITLDGAGGTQLFSISLNGSLALRQLGKAFTGGAINNSGRLLVSTCAKPLMPRDDQAAICLVGREVKEYAMA